MIHQGEWSSSSACNIDSRHELKTFFSSLCRRRRSLSPSLHDIPISLFAYLSFLPSFLINAIVPNRKRKENARPGNNKDKNENAASNTNATHVNPGPRQQSALDIVLAETGAQCRISIILRTIKNHLAQSRVLHSQTIRPNHQPEMNSISHGHLCRAHTQESFDRLSFLDGLVDFHWRGALARWSLADATPVLGVAHC